MPICPECGSGLFHTHPEEPQTVTGAYGEKFSVLEWCDDCDYERIE